MEIKEEVVTEETAFGIFAFIGGVIWADPGFTTFPFTS